MNKKRARISLKTSARLIEKPPGFEVKRRQAYEGKIVNITARREFYPFRLK